ncbi:hypothetical protein Glove_218g13 [Diversispora epigaea]|uniref:NADH dehydrogenase [ubiquinone] 1 beta subcomplex subunit 4 n=1 Tax=Diversispora epigaea TaxID=1348612 RepID=A0A397IPW9_9GLOM|nr:hypothetical protein Glove_218g13 [Diversispora epigaea]
MAGDDHHNSLLKDPAIERWGNMRSGGATKYFRFSGPNIRMALLCCVILPVGLYFVALEHDDKWDLTAKTRGSKFEDYIKKKPKKE